jgi:hypothetical protein
MTALVGLIDALKAAKASGKSDADSKAGSICNAAGQ